MAAGLGFKDFTTGEVLTAADVDGYLMQGVWVFASAAARDAAVTSPQEGNFAYLKDTNVTTYYTGSAWANLDTTGMTNPMTTTGDTIYSSSGSTPARLGIGSTGQVLTVAGGVPSWATPSGSNKSYSLLNAGGTALTGATTITVSGISGVDNLLVIFDGASAGASSVIGIRFNGDTGSNYVHAQGNIQSTSTYSNTSTFESNSSTAAASIPVGTLSNSTDSVISGGYNLFGAGSTGFKAVQYNSGAYNPSGQSGAKQTHGVGIYKASAAITSISLVSSVGNFDAGTVYVYGA